MCLLKNDLKYEEDLEQSPFVSRGPIVMPLALSALASCFAIYTNVNARNGTKVDMHPFYTTSRNMTRRTFILEEDKQNSKGVYIDI
jgi:hypothetical protein